MLKLATVTATADYVSIGETLSAQTDQPFGAERNLRNGLFTNNGDDPITMSTPSDNDDVSVSIPAGESLPFEEVNLAVVFIKADSGSPELAISGDA